MSKENMNLINGRRAFFLSSTSKAWDGNLWETLKFSQAIFFMNISRGCVLGRFKYSTSFPCHKRNVFER